MKGDVKKEESESEGGAGTSEKAECKELSDMIDPYLKLLIAKSFVNTTAVIAKYVFFCRIIYSSI